MVMAMDVRGLVVLPLYVADTARAMEAFERVLGTSSVAGDGPLDRGSLIRIGSCLVEVLESTSARGWGRPSLFAEAVDGQAGELVGLDLGTSTAPSPAGPGHAGEHRLAPSGPVRVRIATERADAAADALASLTGRHATHADEMHLNAAVSSVEFGDLVIQYVSSRTDVPTDLIGQHVQAMGESVHCLSIPVGDLTAARAYLVADAEPFTQWGAWSLLLDLGLGRGSLVELVSAG